jgi:hypothetical protein
VDLLAPQDPVFVVDLTPETMASCRDELFAPDDQPAAAAVRPPPAPGSPLRAIALLFARDEDPVLLSIRPTLDTAMLDAVARLIRGALLTGRTVANLVTEAGDAELKRLYFARALPRFIYDGVPAPVRHRVPEALRSALGHRRSRRGPTRAR